MKKTTKKTTKKANKVRDLPYTASVRILGKDYKAQGETAIDAIKLLNPGIAKGKSILTVKKNTGSKTEKILSPMMTFRLFNSQGITKDVVLKQISTLFSGI